MELASGDKILKFTDQAQIEILIYSLECKLTAEQMVVAFTKAEKDAEVLKEQFQQKQGMLNWVSSSVMSMMGYGGSEQETENTGNPDQDMNTIM